MATARGEQDIVAVQDAVKAITAVTTELPKVVQATEELATSVLEAVDKAYSRIESISKAEVKNNKKISNARQDLKDTASKALSYVDQVKHLFQFGRDETRWSAITEGLMQRTTHYKRKRNWRWLWLRTKDRYTEVATPDPRHLNEFIDELKRILGRVEEFYQQLKEGIKKAIQTTVNAADECRYRAGQSKREADKAGLTGGVTTVVTSLVSGLVSSIVGGPVAGVAVGAAVATGGVGLTAHFYQEYKNLEDAFKEQHTTLESLAQKGCEMEENTQQLHYVLEGLARAVDDIEYCLQKPSSLQSVCHHLRLLQAKFEETSSVPSVCYSKIHSCLSNLE